MANRDFASPPGDETGAVQSVLGQARDVALNMARKAKSGLRSRLDDRRHDLAEGIDDLGAAVAGAAGKLEQQGHPSIAGYAQRAGKALQQYSSRLGEKSLDDIADDLGRAIQQRPGLLLAGCFLVGFVTARLLKSSDSGRI
jgi:hypothetical protein